MLVLRHCSPFCAVRRLRQHSTSWKQSRGTWKRARSALTRYELFAVLWLRSWSSHVWKIPLTCSLEITYNENPSAFIRALGCLSLVLKSGFLLCCLFLLVCYFLVQFFRFVLCSYDVCFLCVLQRERDLEQRERELQRRAQKVRAAFATGFLHLQGGKGCAICTPLVFLSCRSCVLHPCSFLLILFFFPICFSHHSLLPPPSSSHRSSFPLSWLSLSSATWWPRRQWLDWRWRGKFAGDIVFAKS